MSYIVARNCDPIALPIVTILHNPSNSFRSVATLACVDGYYFPHTNTLTADFVCDVLPVSPGGISELTLGWTLVECVRKYNMQLLLITDI